MADDREEDDPVVKEIDVYLSKSLLNSLYLIQYPLRPFGLAYDNFNSQTARIKPKQKKVEITLSLDTRSKNYASSRGEQIALNVDGDEPLPSNERYFYGNKMDKIVLSSPSHTESFSNAQYAIALFKGDELHLTPLDSIVQLRPSLEYLDKADSKTQKEKASTAAADAAGDSSQDEAEEEATPVSMKMARAETEEVKARRFASFDYINQRREEERWINLSYHGTDSPLCDTEREQLQAGDAPDVPQFKLTPSEYLTHLIPPSSENESEKPAMPNNVLSLNELRKLDLNDQIKQLLINVKVIRFSQLISFLAPGTDHQAVLRSLQSMAVLVQGCWVVKSEYLYPDEDKSGDKMKRRERQTNSLGPELYRRVRDYAMWKFTHCKFVVRKDISHIVQLPSDDVKEILEKMSRLKANKGWGFLYDYDREFCERFPEIVQRQRNKWQLMFHTLAQHFKMPKDGEKKALEMELALMNQQPSEKPRSRRLSSRSPRKRTLSGRSQSDLSDIEADSGDRVHNSRKTSDPFDSATNGYASLPNGAGAADVTCKNSRVTTEQEQELDQFVREVLLEHGSLQLSEIRNKISFYSSKKPPNFCLRVGVTDKMIEDSITPKWGVKINFKWPSQNKMQPVYGFLTGNQRIDKMRRVLFSLFEESCKVRSNKFRARVVEDKDFEDISDSEIKKFLRDHCDTTQGYYHLRGVITS